jgi:hypothetical protein
MTAGDEVEIDGRHYPVLEVRTEDHRNGTQTMVRIEHHANGTTYEQWVNAKRCRIVHEQLDLLSMSQPTPQETSR